LDQLESSMIKAVIFDYFGVLVTEGLTAYRENYIGNDLVKAAKLTSLVNDFNRGKNNTSYEEFLASLGALAGIQTSIVSKYLDSDQPNKILIEFIRNNLKSKYKIGILSNSGEDWINETLSPPDVALFDEIVLSFKYNMIKPEPDFYKLIAKKLNTELNECLFVDDIQRYCDGATSVGMESIHFIGTKDLITELATKLANSNN